MKSITSLTAGVALLCALRSPAIRAADRVPLAVGAPVLELFAVWRPHCQREVAALNRLAEVDGERVDIGFDGFFSIAYDYGVASFPTIYFVDAERRVAAVESGEVPFEHADAAAMSPDP